MKVSVIIPLFNKAPYVKKALESVKAQTFTDYECIIINDGSTDDSATIAEQWIKENSCRCGCGCRLITQTNAGVSAARNKGIALAQGDYITFLDADDWWAPSFLCHMVNLSQSYSNAGILACNYYKVRNGKLISFFDQPTGPANYFKMYNTIAMPITTNSVLIKRSALNKVAIVQNDDVIYFKSQIKMGEDFDLWVRLVQQNEFIWCNEYLSFYNNDVPVGNRAVGNLYNPENHFLWNIADLEQLESTDNDIKQMLDNLRVHNLKSYLLNSKYREASKQLLAKVDWSKQPLREKIEYKLPIYVLIFNSSLKI